MTTPPGPGDPLPLTAEGIDVRDRLQEARREHLAELVADWEPEDPAVDQMIERLARELGRPEPSAVAP